MIQRRRAIALFEMGFGDRSASRCLSLPRNTVRKWLYTYRVSGKEALLDVKKKTYSQETKLAAVRDVLDSGVTKFQTMERYGIKSCSALERWCRDYAASGPDALAPKPKGRPRKEPAVYASREEELEAHVRELELELEIQKRINALAEEAERKRLTR